MQEYTRFLDKQACKIRVGGSSAKLFRSVIFPVFFFQNDLNTTGFLFNIPSIVNGRYRRSSTVQDQLKSFIGIYVCTRYNYYYYYYYYYLIFGSPTLFVNSRPLDKMVAKLQTTNLNAMSSMKIGSVMLLLKYVPYRVTGNKSPVVYILAWHRTGCKPLSKLSLCYVFHWGLWGHYPFCNATEQLSEIYPS